MTQNTLFHHRRLRTGFFSASLLTLWPSPALAAAIPGESGGGVGLVSIALGLLLFLIGFFAAFFVLKNRPSCQRNHRETEILVEIGRLISSTLDIDEVYDRFAAQVRRLCPFDRLNIVLFDFQDQTAKVVNVAGMEIPGRTVGHTIPVKGSMAEEILQTRRGILFNPASEAEVTERFWVLKLSYGMGLRSFLTVPLMVRDRVIGQLTFQSRTPHAYGEEELRLGQRIADQIAGTIAGAQLFAELKEKEQSLRESEARLRVLFDQAAVGVTETDFNTGRYLTVNRRQCELLGMTKEELLAADFLSLTHPEDRELHLGKKALLAAGKIDGYSLEKRYVRKDGRVIWGNVMVTPLWKKGELPDRSLTVVEDITERKLMAGALQRSEKRYRQIFEEAQEGIFQTTPEGRWLSANPAMAGMCGYDSPEEMIAAIRDVAIQLHALPEEWIRFKQVLAEKGRVENFEYQVRHKDGRQIWVSANAREVRDDIGTLLYYEGTLQDVTRRKEAEEERLRLEERLRRAEKMEALGTLAGGVAHDLNNVLGALVGYSELLLNNMEPDNPQRRYVDNILNAGMRGSAIIQDLLTLARRGVPVSEVANLNRIISGYFLTPELERLKAGHPLVTFKVDLDEALLNIQGSPVHLNKTIMNLVTNAVESITGSGEVEIRTGNVYMDQPVKGYDEIQEGDYAFLTVADNGRGIPADDIGKIFEPFYTKKVMGKSGTGLGLAVVWGSVKDHRGYIDVQSEEGSGSRFTLYFPVTREELTEGEAAVEPEAYRGKGETILVVDDIREQRELAVCLLTRLGYRVTAAASGEEALVLVREKKFDLLVLDMIMDPGMDGLDTYRQVHDLYPGQKAVLVSGYSETDRVREAQALGAGAYVRKPYIMEHIGLAIRKEMDRS